MTYVAALVIIQLIALIGLCLIILAATRELKYITESIQKGRGHIISNTPPWIRLLNLHALSSCINTLIEQRNFELNRRINQDKQLDAILNSMDDSVLITDNGGFIQIANSSSMKLFSPDRQITGRKIESIISSPRFLELARSIKQNTSPVHAFIETRINARVLYLQVTGATISTTSTQDGPLYLFVLHDATKLRSLERIRKEFVANASHELRTPTTIIKGYADTLIEDYEQLDDPTIKHFLIKIQRNSHRLHNLLEDLLALSHLEAEGINLNLTSVHLKSLISSSLENLQEAIEAAGAKVHLEIDPAAELVVVDPLKLSQVFYNLIENAIHHAKGFTELTIQGRRLQNTLIIKLCDNGCGIPEADVSRIFERFYRVDKGRTHISGGTGLGLSIVKHVIQLHNGDIQIESAPRQGASFTIKLPIPSPRTPSKVDTPKISAL